MNKKIDIIKALIAEGKLHKALAMASKFQRLGAHREAIVLGHDAHAHADMYRQMGKNPEDLVNAGISALLARYK